MKKNLLWATLFAGAAVMHVPVLGHAQNDVLHREITQLFQTAEQHNATLQTLQSAINEAQAGIDATKTAKLPDVKGEVSVSYFGNARMWNRHFGESTSAPMPHYGNNFLLSVQQVLYAGGGIKAGIVLAQQNAQMSQLNALNQRQQVRFMLVGLYLQLHNLANQQRVYAQNEALAETQISLMQKRRSQGVSLKNDITRYELQQQQMQLAETTVIDNQSIVRKKLNTALGTDSVVPTMLGEEAFEAVNLATQPETYWQQLAIKQHFGMQQSQLAVDMSHNKIKLEKAELRPKIALIAEDHLDGPITIEVPPINKNLNYWFVGVGVSYNFSSLFKNKRKVKQAELAAITARGSHTELQQQVSDEVHKAYVDMNTARTALATCQKSKQLATENYEVVSKRYENGLALVTELTDAANMKLSSELDLTNARINLIYTYYYLNFICNNL